MKYRRNLQVVDTNFDCNNLVVLTLDIDNYIIKQKIINPFFIDHVIDIYVFRYTCTRQPF